MTNPYRDEEELLMKITLRRYEVDLRLTDAYGEILWQSTTTFAKPVNVGGLRNFIRKEAMRLSDLITEAIYIAYEDRQ